MINKVQIQNHRITAWLGLAGTSVGHPVQPLPKQGHPEQAAQHRLQAGLEYLQRRRLHSLPGQPGPGLHHPQSEEDYSYSQAWSRSLEKNVFN